MRLPFASYPIRRIHWQCVYLILLRARVHASLSGHRTCDRTAVYPPSNELLFTKDASNNPGGMHPYRPTDFGMHSSACYNPILS